MGMGAQFKYLREMRGYSIPTVSRGIVTVKRLEDFENGKSDIPVAKFQALLLRMGITLREFAHLSERMTINSGTLRRELEAAYTDADARRLRELFTMLTPKTRAATQLEFFGQMTAAGDYYALTGERLVDVKQCQRLVKILLTGKWNEAEVNVLTATLDLLPDKQVFMLCREVLTGIDAMRLWNSALYVSAWGAVLEGYRVLIQRRSDFTAALARAIANAPAMAETLLQNRFKYIFLNAIRAVEKSDTLQTRAQLRDAYAQLQAIGPRELLRQSRKVSEQVLNFDPAEK